MKDAEELRLFKEELKKNEIKSIFYRYPIIKEYKEPAEKIG